MDKGFVEIKIEGSKGNLPLSPDNYDIGELIVMLQNAESLLYQNDYTFSIRTSMNDTREIKIDKTTAFYKKADVWADAEFYFYGKIIDAGGKDKANIHVVMEDEKTVTIDIPMTFLEQYDKNLLYKTFGIRATGKQNLQTGEINESTLKFVEFVDYTPKYDAQYLRTLREKAKNNWLGDINPDSWLSEIRGSYKPQESCFA